jgi:NADP-dependent 3-hydroxy acid dehydrogenase YdfG
MRKQQAGTIVNINSIAGQNASVLSGASYVMSKFALAGLTQSINAEEAKNNIRATSIFPGDINTEILEKRPTPPPPEARAKMLQPEDVAQCVLLAINLPARAVVEELRIVPR